jgi:uncharacterized protein (DUF169 family)
MHPQEIADELERMLRLDTRPTAIKFYESRQDLPWEPPNFPLNVCQLISMARHQGQVNSGVPDSMVCAMGAACLGLIETPDVFTSGKAVAGIYSKDEEVGRVFMANTFKLGDTGKKYDAVVIAPLSEVEEEPDVVVIHCNPAQVIRLVHACAYDNGEKVSADTVAEAAVCSSIGFAAANGKPIVGFPCVGERVFGGTQNHELVFVAPYSLVRDKLVANLEVTAQGGISVYPVPPNMNWIPSMPPDYTMQPEYLKE